MMRRGKRGKGNQVDNLISRPSNQSNHQVVARSNLKVSNQARKNNLVRGNRLAVLGLCWLRLRSLSRGALSYRVFGVLGAVRLGFCLGLLTISGVFCALPMMRAVRTL